MKLYKYTTIESLIRLLKDHRIRLVRADLAEMYNENLVTNSHVQDNLYLTYFSDWISESAESYALWRMFGKEDNMVRIEIDSELIVNGIETIFENSEQDKSIILTRNVLGKEEPVSNNLFSLSAPDKNTLLAPFLIATISNSFLTKSVLIGRIVNHGEEYGINLRASFGNI